MCDDCGRPERSYTWIRGKDGKPKRMQNGGYVMQNEYGACFGFTPAVLDQVYALLKELEGLE